VKKLFGSTNKPLRSTKNIAPPEHEVMLQKKAAVTNVTAALLFIS
jgi:hypothetical protein